MKELWTEKHRPTDIDNYVFRDDMQREQVAQWIKDCTIPHLLFSGAPGTGKTTLAKILIHQLGIDEYDILEMNSTSFYVSSGLDTDWEMEDITLGMSIKF